MSHPFLDFIKKLSALAESFSCKWIGSGVSKYLNLPPGEVGEDK
jgi:hypothetical protein